MRRSVWSRLAAVVLGLWLALVLGEPGIVRICPAHDGAAPTASTMGAHAMGAHATGASDAPAHEHQSCTCIGCCLGVTAVALLDRVPTAAAAVVDVPTASADAPVGLLPRPGPPHARPYSTGPPRA